MIFIYVFVFIFGAVLGSFLNVCIYRMPRGESIVFPSSHCPNCKRPIPWYCNVPFISYIMLGERCKFCKAKIASRYFIVEGLAAFMFLLLFLKYKMKPDFAIYVVFSSALIIISFIDIEHWIIPDELSMPGVAVGLILSGVYPALLGQTSWSGGLKESFLGVAFGFTSLFLIGLIGKIVYKREAMGGGDVKLLMFIGAFLGWKLAIVTFFLSTVLGSIVGLPKFIKKDRVIQYGPFLALAAFIVVLFRDEILNYVSFIGG